MKKCDIKIGETYTVIFTSWYMRAEDKQATRATVVADLGYGAWQAHFDEPMYNPNCSTLRSVEAGDDPRHISHECTIWSRHIVAPFDEYTSLQERFSTARSIGEQVLTDFGKALNRRGQSDLCLDASISPIPGEPEVSIHLNILPGLLEEIAQALSKVHDRQAPDAVSRLLFSDRSESPASMDEE